MPKPLLKRVSSDDLPDDIRAAHNHSMNLRGDATFFEVFGNHPDLYRWYTGSFYGEVFNGGLVAQRFKEIARLRLSLTHGCRFCNQGNRVDALAAGLSEAEIDGLITDNLGQFTAAERTVIELADKMVLTNTSGALGADDYASLQSHFSDAEILELGMVMGILSGMAKFLFAFDLVEKEPNCPIPSPG